MITPPDWSKAYCAVVDPEVFFDDMLIGLAISFCNMCDIRVECLQYALKTNQEDGVWGGVSPDTRRYIKVPRDRVKCPACASTMVDDRVLGKQHCNACGLSWEAKS